MRKKMNMRANKMNQAKNTAKRTAKRTAAMLLAGAMLAGSTMTTFAAESDVLRQQATAAFEAADYAQARELFAQLIASGEANVNDYWLAAGTEYNDGNYMRATEWFTKTLEQAAPTDNVTRVQDFRIRAAYNVSKYDLVEEYYLEAMADRRVTPNMKLYYADALMQTSRYEKALAVYTEVMADYADDAVMQGNIHRSMGNAYMELEDYVQAEASYQQAYELNGDAESYESKMVKCYLANPEKGVQVTVDTLLAGKSAEDIGTVLKDNGYYAEALTYFETAAAEGADVRRKVADTHFYKGNLLEAAELYQQLLAENPEDRDVMNMLGSLYCDGLGQYEEAQALFDKIVALNPKANGTMGNMAVVARKSGDFDLVTERYRALAERFTDYKDGFTNSIIYTPDITVEGAMEILSGYEDWPTDPDLQAMLLADTIDTSVMTDKTMESYLAYFTERSEQSPENYYNLRSKGFLLRGLGRYAEAIEALQSAISLSDIHSYSAETALAACCREMGDYLTAAEIYQGCAQAYDEESCYLSAYNCFMYLQEYEQAQQMLEQYAELGGETDLNSYYMLLAYQKENYEDVLTYAEAALQEAPDSVKAKAYKAAALKELGLDGADAVIADIDSITYAYASESKLIAECVLGRLDNAKAIYREMLAHYPGDAEALANDYELRNLFADAEFCEMAGREMPEEIPVEVIPEESGSAAEGEKADAPAQTPEEASNEAPASNPLPLIAGTGLVVAVAGFAVSLLKKRDKKETDTK